jgi:hypothetical protein
MSAFKQHTGLIDDNEALHYLKPAKNHHRTAAGQWKKD